MQLLYFTLVEEKRKGVRGAQPYSTQPTKVPPHLRLLNLRPHLF